jgi:phosphomannomutase
MTHSDIFPTTEKNSSIKVRSAPQLAFNIGRAFCIYFKATKVVLGYSTQTSLLSCTEAFLLGLKAQGSDVLDIGICSLEELNFAVRQSGADGGIRICNHIEDELRYTFIGKNGLGTVCDQALADILNLAQSQEMTPMPNTGKDVMVDFTTNYVLALFGILHCLCPKPLNKLAPLKVVLHMGENDLWPLINTLQQGLEQRRIPITLVTIHHEPNSLLAKNLPKNPQVSDIHTTALTVISNNADFGVLVDPNTSSCRFIDENGNSVTSPSVARCLAHLFTQCYPQDSVTIREEMVTNLFNFEQRSRIKTLEMAEIPSTESQMRKDNASYGFCSEQFHYFRHLAFAKSALLPWLLICIYLSEKQVEMSQLLTEDMRAA